MINILVSFDAHYMPYTQIMLFSLCKNTHESVKVWLLNQKLSDANCSKFRDFLLRKCQAELEIIEMDASMFKGMPTGILPLEAYSRVIAQWLLPDELDRVLWLDGDIIVNGDVSAFYHQDLEDYYCVACKDNWSDTTFIKEHQVDMGMSSSENYFNSGVLLLNLVALRKKISMQAVADACALLKNRIRFADQDVLNYLYLYHVKYADKYIYNCQRFGKKDEERQVDYNKVLILHYTGIRKPWDVRFFDRRATYYWRTYVQCWKFRGVLHCVGFCIVGSCFYVLEKIMRTYFSGVYNKLKMRG